MTGFPLVAMVVPVYNNKQDVREFLESVKKLTYPNYRVIIIDDASTDGTEEMIKQDYKEVILLKGDGNLWWPGGTNKGTEKAIEIEAGYVLWINDDTVVDPDFLTYLVDTAENNPRSIVAPKVYYYYNPKMIQQAGWENKPEKHSWVRTGTGEIDDGQYDIQRDIPCASIGALINTSFFKEIGMLDSKNMPQYGSDTDFILRATKKRYRIIYEPRSKIWHKEMATTKSYTLPSKSFLLNLIYLTTSRKSTKYFRMNMVFCFRHSPKYIWPRNIMSYVCNLVRKSMAH